MYPQLSVNHISVLSGTQWNVVETTDISCQTLQILRGDTLDMQIAFPVICLLKIVFSPSDIPQRLASVSMCFVSNPQYVVVSEGQTGRNGVATRIELTLCVNTY